jgi:hypothetical protein
VKHESGYCLCHLLLVTVWALFLSVEPRQCFLPYTYRHLLLSARLLSMHNHRPTIYLSEHEPVLVPRSVQTIHQHG